MPKKKAAFLSCQGDQTPSRAFLLEYQRCVLFALEKEGILDQEQLEACIYRLEKEGT